MLIVSCASLHEKWLSSKVRENQFSALSHGTAEKSLSIVTTVQLPNVIAIAAIIMSF